MSKHLAVLYGPQHERINVICDSEAEARALEARAAETRNAETDEEEEEGEVCPTCGRPKLKLDEEEDEL